MDDPTSKSKITKFSARIHWHVFFEKILRIVWFLIIAFVIIETVHFGFKLLAKKPAERICYDTYTCFNYCEYAKEKVCILPEKKESLTAKQSLMLLVTGRRNIIELLNDQQGYCGCQTEFKGETNWETFYKFYWENR